MHKVKNITVNAVKDHPDRRIAIFYCDFLNVHFCLAFHDTLAGAVALTEFYEMIQSHYRHYNIKIIVTDKAIHIKNPALLFEYGIKGDQR